MPAFCYHTVDAESFAADLGFLQQNRYVTIGADTMLDHLSGRRAAPKRAVVLTIDDGANNLYSVSYPLIRRFGMKAVAFIAPRFHGGSEDSDGLRPCSWPEIRQMHESGHIDFQSHTYEHRYVPRWPEPAEWVGCPPERHARLLTPGLSLLDDFQRARDVLREELGKTIRHLAFPQYNGTLEAIRIGQRAGYEGFWWGMLARRPQNEPGQPSTHIARISGEFLRRLPGTGRVSLMSVLRDRYRGNAARWLRQGEQNQL